MIDWSNNDMYQSNNNLYYSDDIYEGIFLNKDNNINNHYCQKCNDKENNAKIISDKCDTKQQLYSIVNENNNQESYKVIPDYINPMERFSHTMKNNNNIDYFSMFEPKSNIIVFVFVVLLFLIYIELRISNIIKYSRG